MTINQVAELVVSETVSVVTVQVTEPGNVSYLYEVHCTECEMVDIWEHRHHAEVNARGHLCNPTCRTCGAATDSWADLDTPVGVVRVALCDDCVDYNRMPRLGWAETVGLAMEHPDYVESV